MGKSASMTLPTKITIVRLVMIPLIIACYCLQPLYEYLFVVTALLFIIASLTDFIDGHIARKYNMVSDLGKLLDPIADKVLVAAGLFILIDGNYIPEIPYIALICSVIIIAREFMIGVIRQVAALKSVALAADKLGKAKTATTLFGMTFLLCSHHDFIVFSRARENTTREPSATAPKVRKKAGQVPKSIPPAAAVMLLGMGASTTDRNCRRKKTIWAQGEK